MVPRIWRGECSNCKRDAVHWRGRSRLRSLQRLSSSPGKHFDPHFGAGKGVLFPESGAGIVQTVNAMRFIGAADRGYAVSSVSRALLESTLIRISKQAKDMHFPESGVIRGNFVRQIAPRQSWMQQRRRCRHEFSGEFRKTEEPSRFNLWRLGSCSVRRQQVAVGHADPSVACGNSSPFREP